MNTIRVLTAIVFVSLSTGSIAAVDGQDEIDKAKQAAVDTCMKAAEERYGTVSKTSKPNKERIGGKKGYSVKMRAGHKKVTCIAFEDGEVMFTAG
jgi:hypothetical protein